MKKLTTILLLLISILFLVSCEEIPEEKNNEETENIETVSSGTKERIEYLYEKSNEHGIRYYFDGIFNGLLLKSSEDQVEIAVGSAEPGSEKQSSETSKTTVTVEGVDEINTIKNDNRYLYAVKGWKSNEFVVVDSLTNNTKTYSYQDENNNVNYWYYRNSIKGFYLTETRLIVILNKSNNIKVFIYDNSNPLDMSLVDEYEICDAYYNDSRLIDNKLVIMSRNFIFNDSKIQPIAYKNNGVKEELDYDHIIICENSNYPSYVDSISTIDLDEQTINVKGFYGINSYDYSVSKDNIYIISENYKSDSTVTEIMRVRIDDLKLIGKISQKGTINDLFSINEYNGVLRVATTETKYDNNWHANYKNYLCTYDVNEDKFESLDSIDFADGERIYSASFSGNLGYVVTYLYIDPLFEFDLSNPSDIKIIRQLKSPGVSYYLDHINDSFIMGLGVITTEHQNGDYSYATTDGMKISLFSLDGENMVEEYTHIFDYYYSYSSALCDYKDVVKVENSLTYFIPFFYSRNITENHKVKYEYFHGILGFRVNLDDKKIEIIGELKTYADNFVVMNSKLYAVSDTEILVSTYTDGINVVEEIK